MKINDAIQFINDIVNKIKYYPLTLTEDEREALLLLINFAKEKKLTEDKKEEWKSSYSIENNLD